MTAPASPDWSDRFSETAPQGDLTPRRHPRQPHALLADEHRGLRRSPLLGDKADFFNAKDITIPFAISAFPDELYQAPRSWAERAYPHNLIYYNRLGRGGHFAAWERPQLFSEEMRAALRSLRK